MTPESRRPTRGSLISAAFETPARHTSQTATASVLLDGILRVEHSPHPEKAFLGAIFLAHPAAEVLPKRTADAESLCAAWFTLDEIRRLPWRERDVLEVLRYVAVGGQPSPLTLLAAKGEAFR
jgi:hypothetical protein